MDPPQLFPPLPSATKPDKRGTSAPDLTSHAISPPLVTALTVKICQMTVGTVLKKSVSRKALWGKAKQKTSSCISLKGGGTETPSLFCATTYGRVINCLPFKVLKTDSKQEN